MNTDDRALADLIEQALTDTAGLKASYDVNDVVAAVSHLIAADRLEAFHAKPVVGDEAQRLQDHMEQFHGVCLSASEWDAAIAALQSPPPVVSGEAKHDRGCNSHQDYPCDCPARYATPPVVEEGRREALIERLTDVARFVSNMWVQMPLTYRRQNGDTNLAVGQTLNDAILALTPVEGVGELPAIEPEGERIVAETYCHNSGMYLRTDVIGAVQTAIAEERARHAPHLVHPELRR